MHDIFNSSLFLVGEFLIIILSLVIYAVIFSKTDPVEIQKRRPLPKLKPLGKNVKKNRRQYKEEIKNGKY